MTVVARPVCWVVTDGRAGIENQALGLAEAIARRTPIEIIRKRINLAWPFDTMPPRAAARFGLGIARGDPLQPPWPDLWIGCGRRSVPLTLAARGRASYRVQIQDPKAPARLFDLVAPPTHDGLEGDNVVPIIGAPHRVTRELIAASPPPVDMTSLRRPSVAVLVGGPNRACRFGLVDAQRLGAALSVLADAGAGLMITLSRRTLPEVGAHLRRVIDERAALFYDPADDAPNPYPAMLGVADHVLVTEDSVNMAAEAAASGLMVHVFPLSRRRRGVTKFDRFHDALRAASVAVRYDGRFETSTARPLDETGRLADEVLARWSARREPGRK